MANRFVILPAPIPQLRDEGSEAIVRSAVILSEAKDLSVTPPLRLRQRWISFPIFYFLFSLFTFLP
jgi:hypothetical protein